MDKAAIPSDDITLEMIDIKNDISKDRTQDVGHLKRGQWSSRLEYILSMVGYCVGFGNLWRFPYICHRNGGGAFLIPFLTFLFVAAMPTFFLEAAMSQFSGRGPVHVWSFCPLFKGVGICNVMQIFFYYPYYAIILAWPIYYMVKSCATVLPWTTCDNWWNTDLCVEDVGIVNVSEPYNTSDQYLHLNQNSSAINESVIDSDKILNKIALWKNETFAHSSLEEFWQFNVLGISSGFEEIGGVQWHLVGCLFASYVLVFLSLIKGVRSVGKVVYVTALLPCILLVIIFIRALTLPGAVTGIIYFVSPDFSKLLSLQVWIEACLQVFYSLGIGFGMIATASSYNKFHEPCLRDSILLCFISEGTSILAGFVTFSILGIMSTSMGVPVSEVVSSGPGLGFIAYPEALSKLPLPQLWSFLFFLMLLTVGLDSQFMGAEILTTAVVDQFPRALKGRRVWVTFGICVGSFLLGILYCTQGGQYVFQFLDWYVCSLAFYVVCILETICVAWVYGIGQFSKDVNMMLGRPLPLILKFIWCYVSPVLLTTIFVTTLLRYQSPTYGKYHYPSYTSTLGWCLASLPLIPIPVFMFRELRKHNDAKTFKERVMMSLQPDRHWVPVAQEYREEHKLLLKTQHSVRERFRDVFL